MKISFITKLIDKRRRSILRAANRGRKILKKEGQLDFWTKLLDSLTRTRLDNAYLPKFLLGKSGIDAELSIRQFIFVRLFYRESFSKALLYSIATNKPLRYPLHKEFQNVVIDTKRIKVDKFSCTTLWYGYVLLMWAYGVFQGLKIIYYLFKKPRKLGRYIYFNDLSSNNIPIDNKTHTIINWYFQWKNRVNDIDTVCHSIGNAPDTKYNRTNMAYTDGLPHLNGIQTVKYYFWFVYLSLHSLLVSPINPYSAIMLSESIKLIRVKLANKDQLAEDYLFNVSSPYYRPLWTYEAESKGSRVLFYFYSTNCEKFKTEKGYPIPYPWHLMSWPYYLVWNEYQVNFVKKFCQGSPVIEDVGAIWFSSSGKCDDIPLNSIAVFDVTPKRFKENIIFYSDPEYYTPNIANQFLSDIQLVLSQNHFNMLHKIKRNNKSTDKRYISKINQLIRESNYINFDPQVDALQVIQKTKACISMPFTSTAIIAKQEGRPSVYYDPVGIIQKDDRAAHDIPVLSGINELRRWVESLVVEDFR
tara:strand:- start:1244 stop:2830 length:1587 start_codon:yes stop_codon:yes gene_type:complete